ncbi:hypothetical protein MUK42_19164 [Musa troglodytarum]|uniref:Uncharacterized protein n=1 Tax=Musa troglodytarum TaxID=320322 RepID=A0A9E7F8A3_9LILI|nr:hypothetical protein MUK42_19164 [Musa troglodytarum]
MNVSMSYTTLFFAAKSPMWSNFFGNNDDDDDDDGDTIGWVNDQWSTKLASQARNCVRLIRRANQKKQPTSASASLGRGHFSPGRGVADRDDEAAEVTTNAEETNVPNTTLLLLAPCRRRRMSEAAAPGSREKLTPVIVVGMGATAPATRAYRPS